MTQLFLSTTFYGDRDTDLEEVLPLINNLDIDGIEIGSTHQYRTDIYEVVSKYKKRIITHNFFPPAKNSNLVINLASNDTEIRYNSIQHARYCLQMAAKMGAETYTVHPGFLAMPKVSKEKTNRYDFTFSDKRNEHKKSFSLMLESLTELLEDAEKHKICLAIETEGSLTEKGVLLMETIDEYDDLFSSIPNGIELNLNLAHTMFAGKAHGYTLHHFIERYYERISQVEISHNDGNVDQHLPLTASSYVFDYLELFPDVPKILEFRNATIEQVKHSINLVREYS